MIKKRDDDYYFKLAQGLAGRKSTCRKIKNGVIIVKNARVVGEGYSLCSPVGFKHGQKVRRCPRRNLETGVRYDLCRSLHAEVVAIASTQPKDLKGATLYLAGHYYLCWHCESLARWAGVKAIKVRDLGTRSFYARGARRRRKA